jgi:hypothetical protein
MNILSTMEKVENYVNLLIVIRSYLSDLRETEHYVIIKDNF